MIGVMLTLWSYAAYADTYSFETGSSVGFNGGSHKKAVYELQERCERRAKQWVVARPGKVLHYRAHYNAHLNRCFILVKTSPVGSERICSSSEILYNVDENKEYGQHTMRYQSGAEVIHSYIIRGKYYNGHTGGQAEQKWDEFVKEIMEE